MNFELNSGCIYAFVSVDDTASVVLSMMADKIYNENFEIKYVNGKENISYTDKSIQFVPDDIVCYSDMSVWQFLIGGVLGKQKTYREKMLSLAEEYLVLFEIDKNERLLELTFEQGHLLAMISSFIRNAEILLLEKPFDMLDVPAYQKVGDIFRKYADNGNIVVASYDKFESVKLECDYYVFMHDGEINYIFSRDNIPGRKKHVILEGCRLQEDLEDNYHIYMFNRTNDSCEMIFDISDMNCLHDIISRLDFDDIDIKDLSMNDYIYNYYDKHLVKKHVEVLR
ncbi:MAG: hypothetical protein OGM15_12030 [Lachnospiraceae bacterium]|nr:MAG: hypothetical protein OGM15_12030 [Lachnospiraceae bacterium]